MVKDIIPGPLAGESVIDAAKRQLESGPIGWAKQCGVCHVGGGSMEYDRDMLPYGQPGTANEGDRYTYLGPRLVGGVPTAGGIVELTSSNSANQLFGDNKVEVDCMMCHANTLRTGAAWYKSIGCNGTSVPGPTDDPACTGPKFANLVSGEFYDSYNRNAAVSYGFMKEAASAGIGATINLGTGVISNVPVTIPAVNIASVPNSGNCAQCHARNEADNIGLPMEAQQFGGMIAGYGNYFRITIPGDAVDLDEITADGAGCIGDCKNDKQWNEFGCKTGMGKRSQKTGYGSSDRFGFGICFGCSMFSAMNGGPMMWWTGMDGIPGNADDGVCAMPSVKAACNEKAGADLQANPMAIYENPLLGIPKQITGKMPDYDVHDVGYVRNESGVGSIDPAQALKCASCHYGYSGTTEPKTISATVGGTSYSYTYPAKAIEKADHEMAQGYSQMEKANDYLDGTVTCENCHTTRTHPNLVENGGTLKSPNPTHAGFAALHIEKIDCRTCHIPYVYSSPGRLLLRDWTAGAHRQADGSNGNANHFDFAFNFMDGGADRMPVLRAWIKTPHGTSIASIVPSMLPVWTGSAVRQSDDFVLGWSPAKTRDITAAAAVIAAANRAAGNSWDLRLNGTNDHPPFQGFQLTDPLKIESADKINAMAAELNAVNASKWGAHARVGNARMNLFPLMFDPSHGIAPKEWALGGAKTGGCISCHSSAAVNPMTGQPVNPSIYSPKSVGFFDGQKELLKNGMMQMADYDCGGDDMNYTTGGWSNAANPSWMCGMFDPLAMGGNNNGTCDTAEVMACRTYIGQNLYPQFGMPSDLGPAMPIDGISMMQMMAIREGTFGNPQQGGCDTRYTFFGVPNGCEPGDYFSRDEIRKHFKKNIQQVKFSPAGLPANPQWVNPITGAVGAVPATMGRVFGIVSVGKNPSNPSHANKFDLGATCYNPMTGEEFPCPDSGGYIKTTVSQGLMSATDTRPTLLGYTWCYQNKLMSLLLNPQSSQDPVAYVAYTLDPADSLNVLFNGSSSLNSDTWTWDFGDGATATGASVSHKYAAPGIYTVKLTVTGPCGPENTKETVITLKQTPVAYIAYQLDPVTERKVNFDGTPSLNEASYAWNFGDGVGTSTLDKPSYTYAAAGTYTVTLTVTGTYGGTHTTQTDVKVGKLQPVCYVAYSFDIAADPTKKTVIFDASGSKYAETYAWDFGDGTAPGTGVKVSHKYDTTGITLPKTYTVKMTATGLTGKPCTTTTWVTIK